MASKNIKLDIQTIETTTCVIFRGPELVSSTIETTSCSLANYISDNKPEKLIVDFTEVRFFSSTAIGTLINVWKIMEQYGGTMVISGINPKLSRVFKITNLDKIFTFYPNMDLALKSLNCQKGTEQ